MSWITGASWMVRSVANPRYCFFCGLPLEEIDLREKWTGFDPETGEKLPPLHTKQLSCPEYGGMNRFTHDIYYWEDRHIIPTRRKRHFRFKARS